MEYFLKNVMLNFCYLIWGYSEKQISILDFVTLKKLFIYDEITWFQLRIIKCLFYIIVYCLEGSRWYDIKVIGQPNSLSHLLVKEEIKVPSLNYKYVGLIPGYVNLKPVSNDSWIKSLFPRGVSSGCSQKIHLKYKMSYL